MIVLRWWLQRSPDIAPSIIAIAVHRHHRCAVHHCRCCRIAIALAVLALFLAALIPRSPVGCCTEASISCHLPPLVCCRPPCRHLLVLFLVCRLIVALSRTTMTKKTMVSSSPAPAPLSASFPLWLLLTTTMTKKTMASSSPASALLLASSRHYEPLPSRSRREAVAKPLPSCTRRLFCCLS